ncbi:hypothetical protein [Gelidibacter sp.]|uniref:hypothetical protein n=1 Tax=Gelidibacter sp. TaxID=2018083 RepID=UPI003264A66B
MSISQLEKNTFLLPFLSEPMKSNAGLDQLGLNLTSERIFDMLLPGLNNVTGRIRYYSFYAWFFEWYSNEIGALNAKEQVRFLRRAEFLLALIATSQNAQGVPGITKAQEIFESSGNSIDLKDGTYEDLGKTEGSYWKNTTGIFGQYYANSLKVIGIVKEQGDASGVYIRTASQNEERVTGLLLANAFESNIGEQSMALFTKAIKTSSVSIKDLGEMAEAFNMIQVPLKTEEHGLLVALLVGPDRLSNTEDTFYRKDTILNVLQEIERSTSANFKDLEMPWYAYDHRTIYKIEEGKAMPLWYFFMLEQYWSISCTGALNSVLRAIDAEVGLGWLEETPFINAISESIFNAMEDVMGKLDKKRFNDLEVSSNNEKALADIIINKNTPFIEQLSTSVILVHKIYKENFEYHEDLSKFSKKHNLHTRSSFLVALKDIHEKSEWDILEFIKYFITKYVIYRHHFVALKKMTDSQSTAKFLRENGYIKHVDYFRFGYSSPRLYTLLNFLHDLGIKEYKESSLTKFGNELLTSLKS